MFEFSFEAEQHFVFIDMSEDDFFGERRTNKLCVHFFREFILFLIELVCQTGRY